MLHIEDLDLDDLARRAPFRWIRDAIGRPTTDCITDWPFAKTAAGYLPVRARHPDTGAWTTVSGHRLACLLAHGAPARHGLEVAHDPDLCSGPPCVQPLHLRWVTPAANRLISGSRHLTDDDVASIRAAEGVTQSALAARFGITQAYVSMIRAGKARTRPVER